MHHYFQTEITLENLIWAARRQEFISYRRLNQAQDIAGQNWSSASSLLIRHLDQLANPPCDATGKSSADRVTARLRKRILWPLS